MTSPAYGNLPLLKGGDSSIFNNYRQSQNCVLLSKFLKTLPVWVFPKQHSTITAAIKVLNDIIDALDCRKYCVALFSELSKAFDTTDHFILIDKLSDRLQIGSQIICQVEFNVPLYWVFLLSPPFIKWCTPGFHPWTAAVFYL